MSGSSKNTSHSSSSSSINENTASKAKKRLDELKNLVKETRGYTYKADCIRKRSNWSITNKKYNLIDNPDEVVSHEEFIEDIPKYSPKLQELLEKIDELDKNDMKTHGKKFKHFIFSDIKSGGYGVKMLASAFVAKGMTMGYNAPNSNGKKKYGKIELLSNSTLEKTKYNNFYLLSSVAVYDQPISVSNKKEILARFNSRPDNVYGKYARFIIMDSGYKEGIDLFDIKYIHIFEPSVNMADQTQVIGRGTRTCGQKGLKFHPKMGWPLHVFIYDMKIPETIQPAFGGVESAFAAYLRALNIDLRLYNFAKDVEQLSILGSVDYELNKNIHSFSVKSLNDIDEVLHGGARKKLVKIDTPDESSRYMLASEEDGSSRYKLASDTADDESRYKLASTGKSETSRYKLNILNEEPIVINDSSESSNVSRYKLNILDEEPIIVEREIPELNENYNSKDIRKYVDKYFSDYKWDKIKMENLCSDKNDVEAVFTPEKKKKGGADLIKYTPTQSFVSNYFTPELPIKGMLLWHSVGTGKTCSAIATATSSFERQGYTIIWVTRTTLKNDIWKNMFNQVCHDILRLKISKDGLVIPSKQSKRMKLLSKSWKIRPMSYKQFSNLVLKQNNFYNTLVKINGEVDPLRKTLLVIDEAHKLYGGGDLSSIERPDMDTLHNSVMKSYEISGKDSVKLLLMTATPITADPMELIKLINLCKPIDKQMPTIFSDFSKKYLDDNGLFTEEGKDQYLDDIAGHISYLNREKDARQFSQPEIEYVMVPIADDDRVLGIDSRVVKEIADTKIDKLKEQIENRIDNINTGLKEFKNLNKKRFSKLSETCKKYTSKKSQNKCKKVVNSHIKDLIVDAKEYVKDYKASVKNLRQELKSEKLFKNETLKSIYDNISQNEEDVKDYKVGPFYSIRSKCIKKYKDSKNMKEYLENHNDIVIINNTIDAVKKQIEDVNNNYKDINKSYKLELKEYKQKLKETSDLKERKKIIDGIEKFRKDVTKKRRQNKKDARYSIQDFKKYIKTLNKTKKNKQKHIKNTIKRDLKVQKKIHKSLVIAEDKLKKELIKANDFNEEFKNEFLSTLVNNYKEKINTELEKQKNEIEAEDLKIKAKQAAKQQKEEARKTAKLQKEKAKLEKEAARKTAKLKKEQEKARKQKEKEEKKKSNKTKKNLK